MKDGVYILNTSRGSLIESEALLKALKEQKVGAAGLDVYEEESALFFEDFPVRLFRTTCCSCSYPCQMSS